MTALFAALLILMTVCRSMVYERALSFSPRLAAVAQQRADDMARSGVFSHYDPDGKLAFVRLEGPHLPLPAGENLYACQGCSLNDLAQATFTAWLQSPEHAANLTDSGYGSVGFGAAWRAGTVNGGSDRGWWIVTQEFGP